MNSALRAIREYFRNIHESVATVGEGMRITLKTAFLERKVTLQYPSHDVLQGLLQDEALFGPSSLDHPFEALQGTNQTYKGPLRPRVSDRYRGLLDFEEAKCTSCRLCAQACPIGVIEVKGVKIEGRQGRAPVTYRIDYSKCIFCGLCVEACPTGAVFFSRRFEGAVFDYADLIEEFVDAETARRRRQLDRESQATKAPSRSPGVKDEDDSL
ncbi:MAG: 4Fe-4S binding protein [Thermodesulfobacteriota bacterium]